MDFREKIKDRIVDWGNSIILALKKMDNEGVKLLFVYNNTDFKGILTVGDIQRAIIRNVDLNTTIKNILDEDKVYASESDTEEDIKNKMLSLRIECMPVINSCKELVNVYFWSDVISTSVLQADKEVLDIPVVIMAGGLGTRLQPLTNVIPKPLVPIGTKTILETIMDQFEALGSDRFFLSVNYKSEILKYYLDNLSHKYNVKFIKEEKPLGTIGSVSLLKGEIDTPFFVSNCDIIVDQDFREVYRYHVLNNNAITIITALKNYQIPYGVIETGEQGVMIGLDEKPNLTYMINTGVYILQPELIAEIPKNEFYHITHLINKVRKRGEKVGCFPVSEKAWTDIGDWNEYLKLINFSK